MAKVIPIGGMTCPECEGEGKVFAEEFKVIDCPTCDGKGWVLEEEEDEP